MNASIFLKNTDTLNRSIQGSFIQGSKDNPFNRYGSILNTDSLHCSVVNNGRVVTAFSLTGISGTEDLYRYVKKNFAGLKGFFSILIRNSSQGWTKNLSLYLI